MNARHWRDGWPYLVFSVLGCALGAIYFFQGFFLQKSEGLDYSIFPLIQYARDLLKGDYFYWSELPGIGSPWPMPHIVGYSPVTLLFGLMPPYHAVALTVIFHLLVSGFYFDKLLKGLDMEALTRLFALLSFLLLPAFHYQYISDALEVYIGYLMCPVLFYYLNRVLGDDKEGLYVSGVALGLATGYSFMNGHPGTLSCYYVALAFFALARPRQLVARLRPLVCAGAFFLCLVAGKVYYLWGELQLYGTDIPRLRDPLRGGFTGFMWSAIMRPLLPPAESECYLDTLVGANLINRNLTFGLAFVVLAFWMSSRMFREAKFRPFVLLFVFSIAAMFVPVERLPSAFSATWIFRDPASIMGVILGAKGLDVLLSRAKTRLAIGLGIVQCLQLGLGMALAIFAPYLRTHYKDDLFTIRAYNAVCATEPASRIASAIKIGSVDARKPVRLMTSSQVSYLMDREGIVDLGGINNVFPTLGIGQISYIAKGISFDAISPSLSVPYGTIAGEGFHWYHQAVKRDWALTDEVLLQLLGAKFLLATAQAEPSLSEAWHLEETFLSRRGSQLKLYKRVSDAEQVFLVNNEILDSEYPLKESFSVRCLTSIRLEKLAGALQPGGNLGVVAMIKDDRIALHFSKPLPANSSLIISSLFRPEWEVAGAAAERASLSNWNGLLRIRCDSGESSLNLIYTPRVRKTLDMVGLVALCASLSITVGAWVRKPKRV